VWCTRMVAIAGVALMLAGCGTAAGADAAHAGSSPSSSNSAIGPPVQRSIERPPPQGSPATASGSVLTAADDGSAVFLVPGQRLAVELAPGRGVYAWDRVRLTGSALRLLSVAGGYPGRGVMVEVFLATAPGTTALSTVSDVPCLHARPRCLVAQRGWHARVIVQASSQ
jgi:hypothetical protein